ncbi:hypothetical protein [Bremerella sp.]|uniref:hypothetical protein n=1 Tax=Bremerella sp. TaxID=2795602 RepID=UPI00391BDFFA
MTGNSAKFGLNSFWPMFLQVKTIEIQTAIFGAVVGVLASIATSLISHFLTRKRDVAQRRDQLRAELYGELIDLIVTNEELHAQRTGDFSTPDVEIQKRRLSARHRLRLVATDRTLEAYDRYNHLLRTETEMPRDQWPTDPSEIFEARDELISAMRAELRDWRRA